MGAEWSSACLNVSQQARHKLEGEAYPELSSGREARAAWRLRIGDGPLRKAKTSTSPAHTGLLHLQASSGSRHWGSFTMHAQLWLRGYKLLSFYFNQIFHGIID